MSADSRAASWWSWCSTSLVGPVRADDDYLMESAEQLGELDALLSAGSHTARKTGRQQLIDRGAELLARVVAVETALTAANNANAGQEDGRRQALAAKVFTEARQVQSEGRILSALASVLFNGIAAHPIHRLAADSKERKSMHSHLRGVVLRAVRSREAVKDVLTRYVA